jgi:tricorn protease
MSRLAPVLVIPCLLITRLPAIGQTDTVPLLLRTPTLSRTQIVFSFAGDLWSVPRGGGDATRLTSGPGVKTLPVFSPDGTQIAFTGDVNGNQDVYVLPAAGGAPRRLTFHPGPDQALGWTPDGRRILFRSPRSAYANIVPKFQQLFTVAREGGPETGLPLPMGNEACFSPDGSRLAYVPLERKNFYFKRYRGGRTTPIWVARLSDSHIVEIPRHNSTDFNPMWIGNKIYFLSDRAGPATLFAYDVTTQRVSQVLANHGQDIASASAGPGAIVCEQFGSLRLVDLASGKTTEVKVRMAADFPELRPHTVRVSGALRSARLSPAGDRAVFQARGEILTVEAPSGRARNVTDSPGVMERDPAWSPDGKTLAYFSDEAGEYALHLRSADGSGPVEKIGLGEPPSFYYSPRWSPDGAKIACIDKRQNIWVVERGAKTPVKADTEAFYDYFRTFRPITDLAPVWSPDGRWLAYAKHLKNGFGAIFLYSLRTGRRTQVTDAMHDAAHPAFDPDGTRLYFAASTNAAKPGTRGVYAVSLRKDSPLPTPVVARDDRSPPPDDHPQQPSSDAGGVRIDLEGICQRIRALPVPARDYAGLQAAGGGILFLIESTSASPFDPPGLNVSRLDIRTGLSAPLLTGVSSVDISADGRKALFQQGERWAIGSTSAPPKPGEGLLPTETLEVRAEPRAAWRQMYREVWRLVRDFFYDPGLHGLDRKAAVARYAPYVEGLVSRADLNALFTEMLGDLTVSHVAIHGGDAPQVTPTPVGLLGADYAIENGRYRFARIYAADPWRPEMKAPLAAPDAQGRVGDYLLAVNGEDLSARDNVYRLFAGTAGKPTTIRVGPNPDGSSARNITVTPIPDELSLRQWAWLEGNRRRVAEATRGRVAYIYVPHTLDFDSVNYDLAAQGDREALIIDERFNLGGGLPDEFVDHLRQPVLLIGTGREGPDGAHPPGIHGPKVLLINEYAGSGGDALALFFRRQSVGPIIGKRTWGGLTGAFGTPELMDGGTVEVPSAAFWGPGGVWEVENQGVAPDREVEFDPEQVRRGRDPQLEQAITTVLHLLRTRSSNMPKRPAYPDYRRKPIRGVR